MTAAVPILSSVKLTVRPPADGDLRTVFDLITESDTREYGEPDYTYDEFAADWEALDRANDARVAVLSDGRLVGWATIEERAGHTDLHAESYVHPDHEGIGVGTALIGWSEQRAAEHVALAADGLRVTLQNAFNARNEKAHALLRGLGYGEVRRFWRMQIDLGGDRTTAPPNVPEGVVIRSVEYEADEHRLYGAVEDAFQDHWGFTPVTFDKWIERKKRHGFHPDLWLLAFEGDQVVGGLVGSLFPETGGWINNVAVLRPWRRRGLAHALLLESFRRFQARRAANVALGVDATNPTGATRLYEKAGMEITREFVFYEKELRPGEKAPVEDE